MSDRSVPDQVDIKHKWILSCCSSSSYYWSAANFVPATLKIYDLFWHQIRQDTGNIITAQFRRKPHQLARLWLSSSPRAVTDSNYCRNWMASYNVLYSPWKHQFMCQADHVDSHVWAREKTLQGLPHESNMILLRIAHVQLGTPESSCFYQSWSS
jgi:hypothetical protein